MEKNYKREIKLTPEGQSSERKMPGTIVPWKDIFDKW